MDFGPGIRNLRRNLDNIIAAVLIGGMTSLASSVSPVFTVLAFLIPAGYIVKFFSRPYNESIADFIEIGGFAVLLVTGAVLISGGAGFGAILAAVGVLGLGSRFLKYLRKADTHS
ncbi:MAG: hypothetical protein ABEJ72_10180 [Candidatus Aenigmatarchaeota archaeon]